MKNRLREKYKNGEVAIGTFFSMGDMNCMECLGFSGMDYVIIDTEHGPYDTESMMDLIRVAESVKLSPIVRIADVTHKEIQRAADCGADGLIVPCEVCAHRQPRLHKGTRKQLRQSGVGVGYA